MAPAIPPFVPVGLTVHPSYSRVMRRTVWIATCVVGAAVSGLMALLLVVSYARICRPLPYALMVVSIWGTVLSVRELRRAVRRTQASAT